LNHIVDVNKKGKKESSENIISLDKNKKV